MSDPKEPRSDFIEASLDSISVTNVGFILFLKGEDESRVLPIFIGANEAQSIALALNEEPPPRPMTHDLMKGMLETLDCAVTRVDIIDIREGTFFGRVHMSRGSIEETEYDARPSDAIALALRFQAPIFMHRKVFEEAAVAVVSKEEDKQGETPESDPSKGDDSPKTPLSPAEKLRADLDTAVREERYEEAAHLRDALKRMQSGN